MILHRKLQNNTKFTDKKMTLNTYNSFNVMIRAASILDSKFTYKEILNDWWYKVFSSPLDKYLFNHDILKLRINLFNITCKANKILLPRFFYILLKQINDKDFYTVLERNLHDIEKKLKIYVQNAESKFKN